MVRTLGLWGIVLLALPGCTSVAGTVASSGASAFYNNQSLQKSAHDQYVTLRAYQAMDIDSDHFKNANINISTFNNVVLLTGQVPESWQKTESEQIVRKVAKVDDVYNLLDVGPPTTQWDRTADTWITTKIKAKLLVAQDIDATQIKVITERRKVFLMGILKPDDAEVAVNAARSTDGVQEVVKIFSYIKISKTPV